MDNSIIIESTWSAQVVVESLKLYVYLAVCLLVCMCGIVCPPLTKQKTIETGTLVHTVILEYTFFSFSKKPSWAMSACKNCLVLLNNKSPWMDTFRYLLLCTLWARVSLILLPNAHSRNCHIAHCTNVHDRRNLSNECFLTWVIS